MVRALVTEAFRASPLERVAARRWQARTDELIWAFDLDRGRSWNPWAVMTGIVVRERHPGLARPRHNEGEVMIEYPMLGDAVPPAAAGSRFDDHLSYFTMAFDHKHDLISADERGAAYAFMAGDLARMVQAMPEVRDLRAAVKTGLFARGFVLPALRKPETGDATGGR